MLLIVTAILLAFFGLVANAAPTPAPFPACSASNYAVINTPCVIPLSNTPQNVPLDISLVGYVNANGNYIITLNDPSSAVSFNPPFFITQTLSFNEITSGSGDYKPTASSTALSPGFETIQLTSFATSTSASSTCTFVCTIGAPPTPAPTPKAAPTPKPTPPLVPTPPTPAPPTPPPTPPVPTPPPTPKPPTPIPTTSAPTPPTTTATPPATTAASSSKCLGIGISCLTLGLIAGGIVLCCLIVCCCLVVAFCLLRGRGGSKGGSTPLGAEMQGDARARAAIQVSAPATAPAWQRRQKTPVVDLSFADKRKR